MVIWRNVKRRTIIFKKRRCLHRMLGLEDPGVVAAYLLTIGGAALCVVYGLIKWNSEE